MAIRPEDHLGLLIQVVSKFVFQKGVQIQDTEEYSDGVLGLLTACETYNPELGTTFSTHATFCIRTKLIEAWRRRNRKKRIGNMSSIEDNEIVDNNSISPHTFDVIDFFLNTSDLDSPEEKRYKDVLYRHYIKGETFDVVGKSLGVSRVRAQQICVAAINYLKTKFDLENMNLETFLENQKLAS